MLNKREYKYIMFTTKEANKRMNVMYESDAHFFSCQKMFYNQLMKLINKKGTAKLRSYLKDHSPLKYSTSRINPANKKLIRSHIVYNPTYTYALKDLAHIVKYFRDQHDIKLYNRHLAKHSRKAIKIALMFYVGDLTMQRHCLPYQDDIKYIKLIKAGSIDFPTPTKFIHHDFLTLKYTACSGSTDDKAIKLLENRALRRTYQYC